MPSDTAIMISGILLMIQVFIASYISLTVFIKFNRTLASNVDQSIKRKIVGRCISISFLTLIFTLILFGVFFSFMLMI